MPVITCPECGGKVSTTTDVCIHCGYKLKKEENTTTPDSPNAKRKSIPRWLLFTGIAIVSLIVVATVLYFAFDVNDYILGTKACDAGDYKLAVQLYDKTRVPLKEKRLEETKQLMYSKASEMITAENWNDALDLLTGLNYSDSEELLAVCSRNKGMSENADFEFLAAFQEAIYRRIEISESNSYTYSDLVAAETSRLDKFSDAVFYDKDLQSLALDYLAGLDKQEIALKKNHSEYQILWQEGIVERYQTIVTLAEKYSLFQDKPSFVQETYASQVSEQEEYLKALKSADGDFEKQFSNSTWKKDNGYQISIPYSNNTGYALEEASIFVFYYDKNGTRIGDTSCYFENLKKGQSTVCEFYVSNARNIQRCEFYWEFVPHID